MIQPGSAAAARLFLALWPDAVTRIRLEQWGRSWSWPPGVRLVGAHRLHVTLHYIGPVPVEHVGRLRETLAVRFEPFALPLAQGRGQVWPGGIAVLEMPCPEPLRRLHESLAHALRQVCLPVEERPYRPHVTFARKAHGAAAPCTAPEQDWIADTGYVLVHSIPGRGYAVLHGWPSHG